MRGETEKKIEKNSNHKVRSSNIHIAKIPKGDNKIMEKFKDIIAENFPKLIKGHIFRFRSVLNK